VIFSSRISQPLHQSLAVELCAGFTRVNTFLSGTK
jgi:hypothetical protein